LKKSLTRTTICGIIKSFKSSSLKIYKTVSPELFQKSRRVWRKKMKKLFFIVFIFTFFILTSKSFAKDWQMKIEGCATTSVSCVYEENEIFVSQPKQETVKVKITFTNGEKAISPANLKLQIPKEVEITNIIVTSNKKYKKIYNEFPLDLMEISPKEIITIDFSFTIKKVKEKFKLQPHIQGRIEKMGNIDWSCLGLQINGFFDQQKAKKTKKNKKKN